MQASVSEIIPNRPVCDHYAYLCPKHSQITTNGKIYANSTRNYAANIHVTIEQISGKTVAKPHHSKDCTIAYSRQSLTRYDLRVLSKEKRHLACDQVFFRKPQLNINASLFCEKCARFAWISIELKLKLRCDVKIIVVYSSDKNSDLYFATVDKTSHQTGCVATSNDRNLGAFSTFQCSARRI